MLIVLNDHGGDRMDVTDNITTTLRAESHHPPIILSYGFKPYQGSTSRDIGWAKEIAPSLTVGENYGVMIQLNTKCRQLEGYE